MRKVNYRERTRGLEMRFGEKLKVLREARGIDQEALAERLKLRQSTISQWESGKRRIDVDYLIPIARALDVSPDLFTNESPWAQIEEAQSRLDAVIREVHDILKKGGASRVTNRAQSEPPSTLSANYHSVKRTLQEVIPPATRRTASIPR